jgi:hypothetical protein
MAEHVATPFRIEFEKGRDYGLVDPVMIGSDIYGWAVAASRHRLVQDGTRRLFEARARLSSSLDEFPATAWSYYELLVPLADAALNSAG